MTNRRGGPPSFTDPPTWLRNLKGFELFGLELHEDGWSAFPEGVTETTEFPGGTWRVSMIMPHDLSRHVEGFSDYIDPLLLVVGLANGAAQVEAKLEELVGVCRSAGKSWTEIGQALGITKQAAWERFSGED